MASPIDFYLEQAADCARQAAGATLDNQRDKYLQAQAAWQALADGIRARAAKRDALGTATGADGDT